MMVQIVNWVCFFSVILLVVQIMCFFIKDAYKICNESNQVKVKKSRKINDYTEKEVYGNYSHKIAE